MCTGIMMCLPGEVVTKAEEVEAAEAAAAVAPEQQIAVC